MEGNNQNNHHHHQGYLPGNVDYDDLMSGAGWPASTDHYSYQAPHPTQGSYVPQYQNQPSFDQFDLQQQTYPSAAYSNSPYTNHLQYQHARPSDVFGPTSYNLDPALQASGSYPVDSSFSFGHHGENNTISPSNLQYQLDPSQLPPDNGASNLTFQRPASDYHQPPQFATYFSNEQNGKMHNIENSVQYPALPIASANPESKPVVKALETPGNFSSANAQAQVQLAQPRTAKEVLRITHPELHAAKNSSTRPRFVYAPFLSWEDTAIQVAPGLKNTLPKYHPRKSRSGKELVPGLDISHASTPARVSLKKAKVKARKEPKLLISKYKGTSQVPKPVHDKVIHLRNDDPGSVKSPPTTTETSSSEEEEETSSEEESEYEEDEDMPVKDISEVRSAARPINVAEAAGWDAIGIIWKDPNSNPNADIVKGAIEAYSNFVIALRVQLKTNSTQSEEAVSRPDDLDRLRRARHVLLESLYQTINAANTLGYPAIVENLGSHQKLVNGLTTTLIECIKTEDFVGKLPKAVFSLLAKFQNMSDALLKKLKFDSITKRWNKKGDDATKKDIAAILANTTEAKEKAAALKKEAQKAEDVKIIRDKIEQSKQRIADSVKATSNLSNPAKRPHDGDGANNKPTKKFASDVTGTPSLTTSVKPLPLKRPSNLLANNLLGISSKPTAKPLPKKREPSPPTESKLGALLAQIAEPVKPPKAPDAKPLPPETPEEKKRRERKESRRHLRVKFKDGPDLEEIRLFKHEQAEDEGRQDDQLRDFGDERSEGMMHKQRVSESMDAAMEDDDYDPESITFEERPYPDLVKIDLSGLDKETTFGPSYATRGGDKTIYSPEQGIQERREASELMVVYTDPKDIPPSPKEPPHADAANTQPERDFKAPSESWVVQRLQASQHYGPEYASQLLQQQKLSHGQAPSTNVDTGIQQLGGVHLSNPNVSYHPSNPQMSTPVEFAAAWENLQRIVNSLKGKPFPPTEPPDWMTNPEQRAQWWDGYNRDNGEKVKMQAEAQMPQIHTSQILPPPLVAPQGQMPHPMIVNPFPAPQPNMVQQAPDMDQRVQAYFASIQAGGTNNGTPAQQQYDYSAWSAGNGQDRSSGDAQRGWEGDRDKDNTRQKKKQAHKPNSGKDRGYDMKQFSEGNSYGNDGLFDENGEYKGKKKPCRFWADGKCAKGAKCTYLHDEK